MKRIILFFLLTILLLTGGLYLYSETAIADNRVTGVSFKILAIAILIVTFLYDVRHLALMYTIACFLVLVPFFGLYPQENEKDGLVLILLIVTYGVLFLVIRFKFVGDITKLSVFSVVFPLIPGVAISATTLFLTVFLRDSGAGSFPMFFYLVLFLLASSLSLRFLLKAVGDNLVPHPSHIN